MFFLIYVYLIVYEYCMKKIEVDYCLMVFIDVDGISYFLYVLYYLLVYNLI